MFAYIANTYFSEQWWIALSDASRVQIETLARISNAYYTDFRYSLDELIPWKITSITMGDDRDK
jgi:hypothetical protein